LVVSPVVVVGVVVGAGRGEGAGVGGVVSHRSESNEGEGAKSGGGEEDGEGVLPPGRVTGMGEEHDEDFEGDASHGDQ
jgi:hypothetical protein